MTQKRVAKYKVYMETDPDFKRWVSRLKRKSAVTSSEYGRKCLYGCEVIFHTTPAGLVDITSKNRRAVEDRIDDWITEMENKKSGGTVHNIVKPLQAWLKFREVPLQRSFEIDRSETRTLNGDDGTDRGRAPTPDELKQIINAATPRARVIIAGVAYSGLRPECFGSYDGMDAIRLGDISGWRIEGKHFFMEPLAKVTVRRPLSKAGHQYFSYFGAEAVSYIVANLNQRLADGEVLDRSSPLIGADAAAARRAGREVGHVICTKNVTADVRDAILKAGFSFRPYDLRTFFEVRMAIAESQKGVLNRFTEFMAGHRGNLSDYYSTHRQRLDLKLEEEMRRQYQAAEAYLSVVAPPPPDLDAERVIIRAEVQAEIADLKGQKEEREKIARELMEQTKGLLKKVKEAEQAAHVHDERIRERESQFNATLESFRSSVEDFRKRTGSTALDKVLSSIERATKQVSDE